MVFCNNSAGLGPLDHEQDCNDTNARCQLRNPTTLHCVQSRVWIAGGHVRIRGRATPSNLHNLQRETASTKRAGPRAEIPRARPTQ